MARYFRDSKKNTVRVILNEQSPFLVVKLFSDETVATAKLWTGDIERTISYWNTREYFPELEERVELFIKAKQTFLDLLRDLRVPFKI